MTALADLRPARARQPVRVLIYGTEGVGKSTFASQAPSPIVLGTEDGTSHLSVCRFPSAISTWSELLAAIEVVRQEQHGFRTLVLDSADWAEPLAWDHVCRRDGKADIEAYGYGKGYVAAKAAWLDLIASLDRLRAARGMHVVITAHALIRTYKNPEGEDYDRFSLKLHDKAGGLLKEWAHDVLFARHVVLAKKATGPGRGKAVSTGEREARTVGAAAYDAKARHALPDPMALSWAAYWAGVEATYAEASVLADEILALVAGTPHEPATADAIRRAGDDTRKLAELARWARGKAGAA